MQRRLPVLASLSMALVFSFGLAGCTAESDTDTLFVIRGESFDGWNPDGAAAYATYQTLANVLEPLLRSNPNGSEIEAGLATEWEYDEDALTWTFTLRDDAKFSDGSPLTSADVAFSLGVWQSGANFGSLYAGIDSVETPDDSTVVFTMVGPDTALPVLMTWTSAAVYPEDFGGRSDKDFFQKPIGAGAYTVDKWSAGGDIVLVASENYYEPVNVPRVVIKVVTDANQGAALIQSGQADLSEYLSTADSDAYGESIVALPASQIEHLSFNTQREGLDDVNVRRAISFAIDYESIVDGPFQGYGELPSGILPAGLANWAPPTSEPYRFDLEAAQAALAEAETVPTTLEIVYDSANETDNAAAQILKENLQEIGIELTLSPLETGAFLDRAYGGDADLVLWSFGAISPDVVDPVGWILGTSWLFSSQDPASLEGHYIDYAAVSDSASKQAIITELQNEAIDQVPVVPLAEFQVLYGVSDRVSGFAATPWGMYRWNEISLTGSE
jgi:peptide/nickel transport system substrate-binding protein